MSDTIRNARHVGYTPGGIPIVAAPPVPPDPCAGGTFVRARHVGYATLDAGTEGERVVPVTAFTPECLRGFFEKRVARYCHWPWGVSNRIVFRIGRALVCGDPPCTSAELLWDDGQGAWLGQMPLSAGTLDVRVECVSDGEGPNDPATVVSGNAAGTEPWQDPGFASASDDVHAAAEPEAGEETEYLVATGFGFSVPVSATIRAIAVEVEAHAFGGGVTDVEVRLVLPGGRLSGASLHRGVELPDADAVSVFEGTPADWGEPTLSPADVNDPGFGVAVRYKNNSGGGRVVMVDNVRVAVVCPATFLLTLSGCQIPPVIREMPPQCNDPLLTGTDTSFNEDCCAGLSGGFATDPIDVFVHGYRDPIYEARHVGYATVDPGLPTERVVPAVAAAPDPDCLGCAPGLCCGLSPPPSNAPRLLATFFDKQGTCSCLPDTLVLTWDAGSLRWEGPDFTCELLECEENATPFVGCSGSQTPEWKKFAYLGIAPYEGSCDPFFVRFFKDFGGGNSYRVEVTIA